MAKPASSAVLDTGHTFYANLTACWPFLEGSGSTSADKKGSRTLSLNSGSWQTDANGDACWRIAAANASPVSLGVSPLTIANNHDFSIAWRSKTSAADTQAMVFGSNADTANFVWLYNNSACQFRASGSNDFTFSTTPTTEHNYVLAFDDSGLFAHLYIDGVESGTGAIGTGGHGNGGITIDTIGNGYTGSSFSFIGDVSYLYVWDNRVITSSEAAALHSSPYALLTTGAPSSWPNITVQPEGLKLRDTRPPLVSRSGPSTGYHSARVVWTGTSITLGNHTGYISYPELVALALPIDSHNVGVGSSRLVDDTAGAGAVADALIDPTKDLNICSVEFGVNDGTTFTSSQFNTAIDAFVAARLSAGFDYVIVLTMLPCTTYSAETFRTAINSHMTSTFPHVADVGNTGLAWGQEVDANDTLYFSDQVHPTSYLYTQYEPIVTALIASLIGFEVSPPDPPLFESAKPDLYVEVELSGVGSGWTDITADVLRKFEASWTRGMTGSTPKDLVAPPGIARWALNNSEINSAGLLGYYSPYNNNCRSGWRQGINCRIRLRDPNTGVYSTRFVGQIDVINPVAGRKGARIVEVTAVDWMDLASRFVIPASVGEQVGKTWDEILTAILAVMPRQPTATSLEAGVEAYDYALDTVSGSNQYVLAEFAKLAASEVGPIYIKGDGTLMAEGRHTRLLNTIVVWSIGDTNPAIRSLSFPATRAEIINRVSVTCHPKPVEPDTPTLLIYDQPNVIAIGAGSSQNLSGSWTDPVTAEQIGAVEVQDQTTADLIANTSADGSGTDISSSLIVTVAIGPNGFTEVMNNVNANTAYVTDNRFYGRGVYNRNPQTVQAFDQTSIDMNDEHPVEFDMPYQGNLSVATGAAEYFLDKYSTAFAQARQVEVLGRTPTLMGELLMREISDRIAIVETVTGLSSEFFINGMTERITATGLLVVNYVLAPAADPASGLYFILDQSSLGGGDILAPF